MQRAPLAVSWRARAVAVGPLALASGEQAQTFGRWRQRVGDISYVVISDAKDSKGRPKAPRVELGHVAEDGTQVPAVPHFYPVVRTLGPKIKRRIASAVTRELRKK